MNYTEYLNQGYINNQIWAGNARNVSIKFPSSTGQRPYDLSLASNNVIVVGQSGNFKQFLYAELFRNYSPQELRTMEIACTAGDCIATPLMAFCFGSRGIHVVHNIKALKLYLKSAVKMYKDIMSCPEMNKGRVEVLILDSVLSTVCDAIDNGVDKGLVEEVIQSIYALDKMSDETNVRIVFMERRHCLDSVVYQWLKDIKQYTIPVVFKCDGETSRNFLKTDVASILKSDGSFYILGDDDIEKYYVPAISGDEFDNLLTKVINCR